MDVEKSTGPMEAFEGAANDGIRADISSMTGDKETVSTISTSLSSYHVRMLTERDIPLVLALCEKNTQFYEHCPPFVTEESIRDDMCALPQRKMDEPQDKYYLGFFDDAEQLVAVMDFIDHYPTERSCFIGFFMMERSVQEHGIEAGSSQSCVRICTVWGYRVYPAGLCGWQQAK